MWLYGQHLIYWHIGLQARATSLMVFYAFICVIDPWSWHITTVICRWTCWRVLWKVHFWPIFSKVSWVFLFLSYLQPLSFLTLLFDPCLPLSLEPRVKVSICLWLIFHLNEKGQRNKGRNIFLTNDMFMGWMLCRGKMLLLNQLNSYGLSSVIFYVSKGKDTIYVRNCVN